MSANSIVSQPVRSWGRLIRATLSTTSTSVLTLTAAQGYTHLWLARLTAANTGSTSHTVSATLKWTDPDAGAQSVQVWNAVAVDKATAATTSRLMAVENGATVTLDANASASSSIVLSVTVDGF